MTLKECYTAIGGDYESAIARLTSENLVKRFIFKFLSDGSYDTLVRSLETEDYEEAFRAAHTIKGICQNLSFNKLFESSSSLTEALRNGRSDEYSELAEKVKSDYMQTVVSIKELQRTDGA